MSKCWLCLAELHDKVVKEMLVQVIKGLILRIALEYYLGRITYVY